MNYEMVFFNGKYVHLTNFESGKTLCGREYFMNSLIRPLNKIVYREDMTQYTWIKKCKICMGKVDSYWS